MGVEPTTPGLQNQCSAIELLRLNPDSSTVRENTVASSLFRLSPVSGVTYWLFSVNESEGAEDGT